jgi:hypothetical protein
VSDEANEQGQQAEASPSKAPSPTPPKFEPDQEMIEVSMKADLWAYKEGRVTRERRVRKDDKG